MSIKYAYIHPETREYCYTDSREQLQSVLAEFAAQVFVDHYCNGEAYTIVQVLEDGSEKWYSPTGEARMTAAEIEAKIKTAESFATAGEIPQTILGS